MNTREEYIAILQANADVVVFALEIYNNVLKWSKATNIHVPKIGLSDGIIRALYADISN